MTQNNYGYIPLTQQNLQPLELGLDQNIGRQPIAPSGYVPLSSGSSSDLGNGDGIFGDGVSGGSFFRNSDGSFNAGNLKLGVGALKTLGSIWSASKQHKLAKQSLNFQQRAFETNLNNQRSSYNTALEDRIRARYHTEGRSSGEADNYINKNRL